MILQRFFYLENLAVDLQNRFLFWEEVDGSLSQ